MLNSGVDFSLPQGCLGRAPKLCGLEGRCWVLGEGESYSSGCLRRVETVFPLQPWLAGTLEPRWALGRAVSLETRSRITNVQETR